MKLFGTRVGVRVRVGRGTRYLRTEKLRSLHLRPFMNRVRVEHVDLPFCSSAYRVMTWVRYKCKRSDRL